MKEIENIFINKAIQKKLNLIFNIDKNIPTFLKGDKVRLNQILINLIGNPLKFTQQGEILVDVKLLNCDFVNKKVEMRFSVKDTGIGIKNEDFNKIFLRFEQANKSISRKYGGTGLGLTI